MPYIPEANREKAALHPTSVGELNYAITKLCLDFLGKEFNYVALNGVIGALQCAQLEFYRRKVVPYEEIKRELHGDVYADH